MTLFGFVKKKIKRIRTIAHKAVVFKRNGMLMQKVLRHFWATSIMRRFVRKWAERFWPVDDKKIVFATFSHSFNCNPASIARELVNRQYPGELVFLVERHLLKELRESSIGQKIRFVNVWSWRSLYETATAKIRLENAQTFLWPNFPVKRPGQLYINTWHGSLGIKRMDTVVKTNKALWKRARLSQKFTDYCISNSSFEDMVFETSFFAGVPKVRLGHARNDIFFQSPEVMAEIKRKCLQLLNLPDTCKIALYAPTFRDKKLYKGFLTIDYEALTDAFCSRFGGEWKILVKLHPHDVWRMKNAGLQLPPAAIDASCISNINELLLATDIGITDYSSWIYDYINLRRPGFIYAPDVEKYKRGFYYPLTDTPFPVAENEEDLQQAVLNFDGEKYQSDVEAFMEKMECVDDGKSSERIADFLENLVAQEKSGQK